MSAELPPLPFVLVPCRNCGAKVSDLDTFPGGICIECHAVKFDRDAKRDGIKRPVFTSLISR